MVRGMLMEPRPTLSERAAALPYFINNLAPALREAWIAISRRDVVWNSTRDDLSKLAPADCVPELSGTSEFAPTVVLDSRGILLGAIEQRSSRPTALDAMNPAPQTIRPNMTPRLAAMLLRARPYLLVTTAEGRYLGRYVSGARASCT